MTVDAAGGRSVSYARTPAHLSTEALLMRSRISRAALITGVMLLTGACATAEEWAEWRKHPTHFASGQHAFFSMRNTEGSVPRVSRRDIEAARQENWWGKVITVSPDQIFQN
jgi:hypothetical protein